MRNISVARIRSIFSVFAIVYLLLDPILAMYGWSSLSFSRILALLLSGAIIFYALIIRKSLISSIPKYLFYYFIWLFICNYLSLGSIIPLGNIQMFLIAVAVFVFVKPNQLLKLYSVFAVVLIGVFAIQEIGYYLFGFRLSGLIPMLPICHGGSDLDMSFYVKYREMGQRSMSLFSEPAHFAQFLIPLLAIKLHSSKSKDLLFAIIIVIVLLLLQSGNALVGVAIIGFMFVVRLLHNSSFLMKFIISISAICVVGLGVGSYMKTEVGQSLMERGEGISSTSMDTSSSFLRMFRGYYVFAEYSLGEKIVGINNYNTIKERRDNSAIASLVLDEDDLYVNCVQDILLRTGIIGLTLFICMCYSLWKDNNFVGRSILLCFIGLSFMASLYMSSVMFLYVYISFLCKYNMKKNRIYC